MGIMNRITQTLKDTGKSLLDPITNLKNVKIPAKLIQTLLRSQLNNVSNLTVLIEDNQLVIKGSVFWFIPFKLILIPVATSKRTVTFKLTYFSPFDFEFIKRHVFSNNRICTYSNNSLTIDFNGIDILQRIPFGSFKKIVIENNQLSAELGL